LRSLFLEACFSLGVSSERSRIAEAVFGASNSSGARSVDVDEVVGRADSRVVAETLEMVEMVAED
jgi:hypothetical protein